MSIDAAELDNFSFDHDLHEYRNAEGERRPSVTETLKHGGLFNYSRIDPNILERKRIIGQNVHAWTARFDISGGERDDLTDLYEEERPYAEAHLRWRETLGTSVQILAVEKPMVRKIHGLELGGTPDLKIRIGARIFIVDRKCCATFHPAWRLQLADYVMLETGRPDCSMYGRAVVRYLANGKFIYNPIDPAWDATDSAVATAFLQTFVWRSNHRLL